MPRSTIPHFAPTAQWAKDARHDDVRHAPMLFRADLDFAYRIGGPVMRAFLDELAFARPGKYVSIDSRAHMLMPGMWPCIPGWHCDDFFRGEGGQPDLRAHENGRVWCEHVAVLVGEAVSLTEWLVDPFEINDSTLREGTLYGRLNADVEAAGGRARAAGIGEYVRFDGLAIHRGVPATRAGWRLFIRATSSDHYEPRNEVRMQTQVYLRDAGAGW